MGHSAATALNAFAIAVRPDFRSSGSASWAWPLRTLLMWES